MRKWAIAFLLCLVFAAGALSLRLWMHPQASLRSRDEIIRDMVKSYEIAPHLSDERIQHLLEELETAAPDAARAWREIMHRWAESGSDMAISSGVLPAGLDRTEALCIIVLGYQLNPDGSMKEELLGRLRTAKASALEYPNAYILCTGGGTASSASTTEAQAMAQWLIQNGVEETRVLTESRSLTTAENAIYCGHLLHQYPGITQAALISSDYHLPWASILFQTQFILDGASVSLVSNAAYPTSTRLYGASLLRYQANGILEIASRHS